MSNNSIRQTVCDTNCLPLSRWGLKTISIFFIVSMLFTLNSCGLKRMLPEGPVLTTKERDNWQNNLRSETVYTSLPRVDYPVIPAMVFGATYDLDIVIVTRNPNWNMHEYAMIKTPDGPLWLAKDAQENEALEQTLVTNALKPYEMMPEIPVLRKNSPFEIIDHSDEDNIDITISYENFIGEKVVAKYKGGKPASLMKKRNGSTMGHSRGLVMAAMDVSHRDFGDFADITYDGKSFGLKKILGLVPFKMILKQSMGGFVIADFTQQPLKHSQEKKVFLTSHRFRNGETTTQKWKTARKDGFVDLIQENGLRTITYRFIENDKALEMSMVTVSQWGKDELPTKIVFEPALPDIRRRFDGSVSNRFVIDINGQKGFAVGTTETYWEGDSPVVSIRPEKPWWIADRPMVSRIDYKSNGDVNVKTERID